MPHQCTNCSHTFPDGSKEMLSGCPSCGGKKFQFLPKRATPPEPDPPTPATSAAQSADRPSSEPAPPDAPAERTDDGADRDDSMEGWIVANEHTDPQDGTSEAAAGDEAAEREDLAQATARRAVVSPDELPASSGATTDVGEADRPDLDELRNELNEQFESIKILRPGQYELNLMELYDRPEHIIAIEEDGRYVIDVPEDWAGDG